MGCFNLEGLQQVHRLAGRGQQTRRHQGLLKLRLLDQRLRQRQRQRLNNLQRRRNSVGFVSMGRMRCLSLGGSLGRVFVGEVLAYVLMRSWLF